METTNNILREMREFADTDSQTIGRDVLRRQIQNFADRFEAAHKREKSAISEDCKRSKYERLHECFWDKRAVQCVIRQMLDERDDLSSIDSVSSNRMDYYAKMLIGAASDVGKLFGNAAKVRRALIIVYDWILKAGYVHGYSDTEQKRRQLYDMMTKALSEPPRNCDRFKGDIDLLREACLRERGLNPEEDFTKVFCEWLLEPAKEEEMVKILKVLRRDK